MIAGGDERGVTVQIGAVLLLAIVFSSLALYQVHSVPEQNQRVEIVHNDEVKQQLQDLRSTVQSTKGGSGGGSVSISLGTSYPSRTVAMNPPNPTGSLETVGTTNDSYGIQFDNVAVDDGSVEDDRIAAYWVTRESINYSTGAIAYTPKYNEYDAPVSIIEHSMLYDYHDSSGNSVVLADQDVVSGNSISLVTLEGELSESRSAASVDVRTVSSSSNTVPITSEDPDEPLNVSFVSGLGNETWEQQFADEGLEVGSCDPDDHDGTYVCDIDNSTKVVDGEELNVITLQLLPGETYDLDVTRVGVGSNVQTEVEPRYMTVVDGPEDIYEGESTELTVEVRDEFDNPVSGVEVDAYWDAEPDENLNDSEPRKTNSVGQATFEYVPGSVDGEEEVEVRATFDVGNATDANDADPESVVETFTVRDEPTGDGNGGAYDVGWADTQDDQNVEDCEDIGCEEDYWIETGTNSANFTAEADVSGASVDFSYRDPDDVGISIGDETDDEFENEVAEAVIQDFDSEGIVDLIVYSGGGSDVISITVEDDEPVEGESHFTVDIDEQASDLNVIEGEEFNVVVDIENTGETELEQDVVAEVDEKQRDIEEGVTLTGGEADQITLSFEAQADDDGEEVTVSSDDDTDAATLSVQEPTPFGVFTLADDNIGGNQNLEASFDVTDGGTVYNFDIFTSRSSGTGEGPATYDGSVTIDEEELTMTDDAAEDFGNEEEIDLLDPVIYEGLNQDHEELLEDIRNDIDDVDWSVENIEDGAAQNGLEYVEIREQQD